ncbi:histidine kinase [Streptosporangium sp. NPDC000396]|uniref:sensor histidine kinase n=1 Tax=Streptosporangium sp. NPDC000396 TaxID=3366185 RepID=UPI0036A9B5C5
MRVAKAIVTLTLVAFAVSDLLPALTTWQNAIPATIAMVVLLLVRNRTILGEAALSLTLVFALNAAPGLLGLLAGSLLLRTPARVTVPSALTVVAVAILAAPVPGRFGTAISTTLTALVVYGLTRMADQLKRVSSARTALAVAAVSRERIRIADDLEASVGRGLETITKGLANGDDPAHLLEHARALLAETRSVSVDYRSLSLTSELDAARAVLRAAGVNVQVAATHTEPLGSPGALLALVLREAVTGLLQYGRARQCTIETGRLWIKVTHDGLRTPETALTLAERVRSAGGRFDAALTPDGLLKIEASLPADTPRDPGRGPAQALAVSVLVAVLVGLCVRPLVHFGGDPLVAALLALGALLQVRHSRLTRPPAWALTLLLQAVVTYAPFFWYGRAWLALPGLLGASALLMLPAPWSWGALALVTGSVTVIGSLNALTLGELVNWTLTTPITALVVYGLGRLAQLVTELEQAREELAGEAVLRERLRAGRDLHDLLGHNLAGILLKLELAIRVDPAHLADVASMLERARADLSAAAGNHRELSLEEEAANAHELLRTAGIQAEFTVDEVPAHAQSLVSVLLREAVTNILRHSRARHATVMITAVPELRVSNDGVPRAVPTRVGSGLANLRARVEETGGTFTAVNEDGWFHLTARLDPAGLLSDAHRVDPVPGVELGGHRAEVVADSPGR